MTNNENGKMVAVPEYVLRVIRRLIQHKEAAVSQAEQCDLQTWLSDYQRLAATPPCIPPALGLTDDEREAKIAALTAEIISVLVPFGSPRYEALIAEREALRRYASQAAPSAEGVDEAMVERAMTAYFSDAGYDSGSEEARFRLTLAAVFGSTS